MNRIDPHGRNQVEAPPIQRGPGSPSAARTFLCRQLPATVILHLVDSLTGISGLRFWWIRRRFNIPDRSPEQVVLSRLGEPAEKERTADGDWWKYLVYRARRYDISYSILIKAGAVITSVWSSSLRRSAG
jgi:hypothetical protein